MRFEKILLLVLCIFALGALSVSAVNQTVLTMTANPTSIPANNSVSTITATLSAFINGTNFTYLIPNQRIDFSTTLGTVSPAYAYTDVHGIATTTLYSGYVPGTAIVRGFYSGSVNYSNATGYVYVTITNVSNLTRISLYPNNNQVVVGASQLYTATCYDQTNLTMACPQLYWTTNAGTMSPQYSTSTSTLTARTYPGTGLYVRATAVNTSIYGQAAVNVVPGPPAYINLTAYPTTVGIGEISTLTARVFDSYGNYVADGTWVSFIIQSGNGYFVNGSNKTTQNGVATALLSSNRFGDVTAKAYSGSAVSNPVTVKFRFKPQPLNVAEAAYVPPQSTPLSNSVNAGNVAIVALFLLAFAGLIATYFVRKK